jgi:hypothetical protein
LDYGHYSSLQLVLRTFLWLSPVHPTTLSAAAVEDCCKQKKLINFGKHYNRAITTATALLKIMRCNTSMLNHDLVKDAIEA